MYQAILFLPLIGAIFAGFFGRLVGARLTEIVTTTLLMIVMLLSWLAFYQVAMLGQEERIAILPWIESGDLKTAWSLRIDTLTAVMLVVVTTVSALVHLYSIGYMAESRCNALTRDATLVASECVYLRLSRASCAER